MPKIFVNGQFYFNLSSKTWSHVFFGTQCMYVLLWTRTFIDSSAGESLARVDGVWLNT